MEGPEGESLPVITVVSGLPRSGTSLMMQMLAAAGLWIASDEDRAPDDDNPRGYLELSAVRRIQQDTAFLRETVGQVVKIVAPLLPLLPGEHAYRILFMQRELDEVMASQRAMLERGGGVVVAEDEAAMRQAFAGELLRVERWLAARPGIRVCFVSHRALLERSEAEVAMVADFLTETGSPISRSARAEMLSVVDPALHRQRVQAEASARSAAAEGRSKEVA